MLDLIPAAKTATNTTNPSPTISAADVTAVLPGFRSAFSRAILPGVPKSLSIGKPIDTRDRPDEVARRERHPDEDEDRPAGEPAKAAVGGARSEQALKRQAQARSAKNSAVIPKPMRRARALGAAGARDMAAMGATRVARRAGTNADSMVTPTPTPAAMAMVLGAMLRPAARDPESGGIEEGVDGVANTRPATRPTAEATTPIRSASAATEARI